MSKRPNDGAISARLRRKRNTNPEIIENPDEDEASELEEVKPRKKQKISQLASLVNSFKRTPSPTEEPKSEAKRTHSMKTLEIKPESPTLTASTDDQWIDKYRPTSLSNTAIHARKLKDVREVLESMLIPNAPIKLLILSGPAGASKSTTMKLLAQRLIHTGTPLIEWLNPIETYPTQFEDFLSSAKYRVGKNKSLILVEDLPNVFHQESRDSFQRALLEWATICYELPPLVLCITECDFSQDDDKTQYYSIENNYTAETIVGRQLLAMSSVRRIKFNPINATLIKTYLKNIWTSETKLFKQIPKSEIEEKILELSLFGDIRAAISAFQLWTNLRSKNGMDLKLDRESTISIFHATGKLIYGTKEDELESVTMERIMKDFSNRADLLKLGLLENYQKLNKMDYSIKIASEVVDNLSWSDCLKPDCMALECAIRSTRHELSSLPVNRGHNDGFNFPRELKSNKVTRAVRNDIQRYIEIEMQGHKNFRSFQNSNLYHGFFEPLINNAKLFKNKSKIYYLTSMRQMVPAVLCEPLRPFISDRLGGPFTEIGVDQDIITEDTSIPYSSNNHEFFDFKLEHEDSDDELDEDPISDTDEYNGDIGDDTFGDDDTFESQLLAASQNKRQGTFPTAGTASQSIERKESTLSSKNHHEFFDDFKDDLSE